MQGRPRAVTAVSERDLVYSDAYFGASFSNTQPDIAYLVAGILGSALASWYFVMTGSAFGLWIRRLKPADIVAIPVPDLEETVESNIGSRIVRLVRTFLGKVPDAEDWTSLDEAVFDLYGPWMMPIAS